MTGTCRRGVAQTNRSLKLLRWQKSIGLAWTKRYLKFVGWQKAINGGNENPPPPHSHSEFWRVRRWSLVIKWKVGRSGWYATTLGMWAGLSWLSCDPKQFSLGMYQALVRFHGLVAPRKLWYWPTSFSSSTCPFKNFAQTIKMLVVFLAHLEQSCWVTFYIVLLILKQTSLYCRTCTFINICLLPHILLRPLSLS